MGFIPLQSQRLIFISVGTECWLAWYRAGKSTALLLVTSCFSSLSPRILVSHKNKWSSAPAPLLRAALFSTDARMTSVCPLGHKLSWCPARRGPCQESCLGYFHVKSSLYVKTSGTGKLPGDHTASLWVSLMTKPPPPQPAFTVTFLASLCPPSWSSGQVLSCSHSSTATPSAMY